MFDIDQILRAGGLFWIDNFYCSNEKKIALTRLIERFGYRKLKWVVGEKVDSGKLLFFRSLLGFKEARKY
jgi:hypothetical protein